MDVHSITQSLCDVALRFGEEGDDEEDRLLRTTHCALLSECVRMSRPFGVALLMAGMSGGEPAL